MTQKARHNQANRCGDMIHKHSIMRQRENDKSQFDPIREAIIRINIARKCINDNKAMSGVYVRDLPESVWQEILNAATQTEIEVINKAILSNKRHEKVVSMTEKRYESERLRLNFVR